jgi:hypothetical protein
MSAKTRSIGQVSRVAPRTVTTHIVLLLALLAGVVLVATEAGPAAAASSPAASSHLRSHSGGLNVDPRMCRPEPPDYPGCTPRQVRPLLRAAFAGEYTGHAYGYRYYLMGQHRRGVIFAHLTQALNAKLARLYHAAVQRYEQAHRTVVVEPNGDRRVVVAYPRFRTWAAFRNQTTSFCTANNITIHFPTQYCWSITKLGEAGQAINSLLNDTKSIALSCDGYAIGGWATGAFSAWRMGTGVLAGGYYGAAGVEIGCQTTHLWNWVSGLW